MKQRFSLPAKVTVGLILLMSLLLASVASADNYETRTYEVTVVNLTGGQPFTPPVIATHEKGFHMFQRGKNATTYVQEIAENGNLAPMVEFLTGNEWVSDFVVAVAGDPPPLMPRNVITVEISAESGHDQLSFVSMLICSNDGFAGVNSVNLPKNVGQSKVRLVQAYDAGTEINTEDFADIVPPCPALTGVESDDDGTGMSNPDLAEGKKIKRHRGIVGDNDLDSAIHGWTGPAGVIVITRTN
ncbi:MAG: spondin domain-containing protein [Anaerolineae bacterium]